MRSSFCLLAAFLCLQVTWHWNDNAGPGSVQSCRSLFTGLNTASSDEHLGSVLMVGGARLAVRSRRLTTTHNAFPLVHTCTSASVIISPMPRLPPVTIATLPATENNRDACNAPTLSAADAMTFVGSLVGCWSCFGLGLFVLCRCQMKSALAEHDMVRYISGVLHTRRDHWFESPVHSCRRTVAQLQPATEAPLVLQTQWRDQGASEACIIKYTQ